MEYKGKNVDPYRLLDVKRDVSEEELKKAYKKMVSNHHPDDPSKCTSFNKEAIVLINIAYEEILKEIEKTINTLKSTLIFQMKTKVEEYQEAKKRCELKNDDNALNKLQALFNSEIASINNCILLAEVIKTREEALRVKIIFDEKEKVFNECFFAELSRLINSLIFIYHSSESQFIVKSIEERNPKMSVYEWFMENQDTLISVILFDKNLLISLDKILDELYDDELQPFVSEEIEATNLKIINQTNDALKKSHNNYCHLDEEFLSLFRKTIKDIYTKYREKIDRRKSKIKYLKFALNISDEIQKILENSIHDDKEFQAMVDSLESGVFNNYLANAQGLKNVVS